MKKERKDVHIYVPIDDYDKIKAICKHYGLTVTSLVNQSIMEYIYTHTEYKKFYENKMNKNDNKKM